LFNLVIEEALRVVNRTEGGADIRGEIKELAFADDVALIAENRKDIKKLTNLLWAVPPAASQRLITAPAHPEIFGIRAKRGHRAQHKPGSGKGAKQDHVVRHPRRGLPATVLY
jgi:hypothetical protein